MLEQQPRRRLVAAARRDHQQRDPEPPLLLGAAAVDVAAAPQPELGRRRVAVAHRLEDVGGQLGRLGRAPLPALARADPGAERRRRRRRRGAPAAAVGPARR